MSELLAKLSKIDCLEIMNRTFVEMEERIKDGDPYILLRNNSSEGYQRPDLTDLRIVIGRISHEDYVSHEYHYPFSVVITGYDDRENTLVVLGALRLFNNSSSTDVALGSISIQRDSYNPSERYYTLTYEQRNVPVQLLEDRIEEITSKCEKLSLDYSCLESKEFRDLLEKASSTCDQEREKYGSDIRQFIRNHFKEKKRMSKEKKMSEVLFRCPECKSDRVTVTHEQTFMVNTEEHYCHSMKTHDPYSTANCLACDWDGRRDQLVTEPSSS